MQRAWMQGALNWYSWMLLGDPPRSLGGRRGEVKGKGGKGRGGEGLPCPGNRVYLLLSPSTWGSSSA